MDLKKMINSSFNEYLWNEYFNDLDYYIDVADIPGPITESITESITEPIALP